MAVKSVKGSIEGLVQGVSQQPDFKRDPAQCEDMLNCRCSLAEGAQSRAGSEYLTSIELPNTDDTPYVADVLYGLDSIPHMVLVVGGRVFVTNADGVTQEVNVTAVADYFTAGGTSAAKMYAQRFNQDIILLNRDVVASMTADVTPGSTYNLLIYVPQICYSRTYTLKVDGVTVGTYTAPDTEGTATTLSGAAFLTWLKTQLATKSVTVTIDSDIAYGTTTKKVIVTHTSNQDDVFVFQGEVESESYLPSNAPAGFMLKYTGLDDEDANDCWLKFKAGGGNESGSWIECLPAGERYIVDESTLPHLLYLDTDDVWKVKTIEWADRASGGADVNVLLPSIFGNTIQWVGEMQNRVVFYSGENYVTTQPIIEGSTEPWNLFITSVRTALATDPIDIKPAGDPQNLLWGTMLAKHLIVTGRDGQYIVSGDEALTNANMQLLRTSRVACDINVAPAAGPDRLFFVSSRESRGYAQVVEYTINVSTMKPEIRTITKHCPTFLQGTPRQIVVDPTSQTVFVLMQDTKTIYVYEWYEDNSKLLQSAWHRWEFKKDVLRMSVLEGSLYIVTLDSDCLCLNIEKIQLNGSINDVDFWNSPVLDGRYLLTPELVYVGGATTPSWCVVTPFTIQEDAIPAVVIQSGEIDGVPILRLPGVEVLTEYVDEHTLRLTQMDPVKVSEEVGLQVQVYVGYKFDSYIKPTMPFPQDYRGNAYIPSAMIYLSWEVYAINSGPIVYTVEHDAMASISVPSVQYLLGRSTTTLDTVPLGDSKTRFYVGGYRGKVQLVISRINSHRPFCIDYIKWSGREVRYGGKI